MIEFVWALVPFFAFGYAEFLFNAGFVVTVVMTGIAYFKDYNGTFLLLCLIQISLNYALFEEAELGWN